MRGEQVQSGGRGRVLQANGRAMSSALVDAGLGFGLIHN